MIGEYQTRWRSLTVLSDSPMQLAQNGNLDIGDGVAIGKSDTYAYWLPIWELAGVQATPLGRSQGYATGFADTFKRFSQVNLVRRSGASGWNVSAVSIDRVLVAANSIYEDVKSGRYALDCADVSVVWVPDKDEHYPEYDHNIGTLRVCFGVAPKSTSYDSLAIDVPTLYAESVLLSGTDTRLCNSCGAEHGVLGKKTKFKDYLTGSCRMSTDAIAALRNSGLDRRLANADFTSGDVLSIDDGFRFNRAALSFGELTELCAAAAVHYPLLDPAERESAKPYRRARLSKRRK